MHKNVGQTVCLLCTLLVLFIFFKLCFCSIFTEKLKTRVAVVYELNLGLEMQIGRIKTAYRAEMLEHILLSCFNFLSFDLQSLHLSITSSPSHPGGRPRGLTSPSQSAAAVTSGQEVKAKVECHAHRVALMPGCCVSP